VILIASISRSQRHLAGFEEMAAEPQDLAQVGDFVGLGGGSGGAGGGGGSGRFERRDLVFDAPHECT
jgi:hypothetical protein